MNTAVQQAPTKQDLPTLLKAQWDRAIAVACIVGAVIVLVVGYIGISDTPYVAEQLPYFISAGAGGVVLCAVAGMMWVSADLRDEWRELRALREQLAASDAEA
ncbi:hypothetical protein GCM10009547_17480 [Sporichthya brevicatena]|uniref:Uncharacterized protein n=1 Tax=Sporichthya brevicatena TaxID=171442 RepID=A0ABN1GPS9_9ACTN